MYKRQLKLNSRPTDNGECVIYVMSRDQRVQDNHALLLAQKSANKSGLPVLVVFNLLTSSGVRSREHYEFMVDGLREVEQSLGELNISFTVTIGGAVDNIASVAKEYKPKEIYFDFNPLRGPRQLQKKIAGMLNVQCSVVDTHNIVPLWVLSDKEEYAAHTIRRKVHKNIEEWLVQPEELKRHEHSFIEDIPENNWLAVGECVESVEYSGIQVNEEAGEQAACDQLSSFIENKLTNYADSRNLPDQDGQSNLSPYLHFGQISSLRIALELIDRSTEVPLLFSEAKLASYDGAPTLADSINAYLEELVVRKELADNYCFYNANYDNVDGASSWAKNSLSSHKGDPRDFMYNKSEWEKAETHDQAWNAAQRQMMQTGKMHGYMRMYWAKKILEWSANPEEAIKITVYLNDKYSIDGGDPNGYTGIMWSIAGVHDRPWFERDVYGKIRYMNEGGLRRKFDLESYIKQWVQ